MFVIIAWIFIIVSLIIILFIVIRKFPSLAILNVTEMNDEKETKFKDRIIRNRVQRDLRIFFGLWARICLFVRDSLSTFLQKSQTNLKKIKFNYSANLKIPRSEKKKKIKELTIAAEEADKQEDEQAIEEKLVNIISLDPKNINAFFQLASLYYKQKKYIEAQETYRYALKLIDKEGGQEDDKEVPSIQEIFFSLAETEKELGHIEAAIDSIREALERESNNPRYLDLILDLSIMKKDKKLAEECLARLSDVNPDNQKLNDWQNEINNL